MTKSFTDFLKEQAELASKGYQPAGADNSKEAREAVPASDVDKDFEPKAKPDAGDIPVAGEDYSNKGNPKPKKGAKSGVEVK